MFKVDMAVKQTLPRKMFLSQLLTVYGGELLLQIQNDFGCRQNKKPDEFKLASMIARWADGLVFN